VTSLLVGMICCGCGSAAPERKIVNPPSDVTEVVKPGPSTALSPAVANVPAEAVEPKLSFVVKLGTTELRLSEREELLAKGTFSDPRVSVSVNPERTFTYVGLEFAYPSHFTFEADLSAEAHLWTLSGNDLKIMIFRFQTEVLLDDFTKETAAQYGANTSVSPMAIKFGGIEYSGRRIHVRLVGSEFTQDLFALPPLNGQARFLMLQDFGDGGTPESALGRDLLVRTFRLSK
jgi:hypothetical protein